MSGSKTEEALGSIAVIGLSCRFPRARNVREFWQLLRDGVEAVETYSDEQLLSFGVSPNMLKHPNYVKSSTYVEDVELFDAPFFGFSPREAEIMDPQQRFFLECAWEAIESAGYDSESYEGSIGVFAGARMSSYLVNIYSNMELASLVGGFRISLANDKDFLPTWVSYKLNLKGPSIAVQTACSTSLVAAHLACQGLLNYQCDMALAGGVAVGGPERGGYLYEEGGIVSPDGHCRAFDAGARGTIGGGGVGIVVLKRLEDALDEGDNILAVIKGSAVNNDGSMKVGFTAPSIEGQTEVIALAQAVAGVEADTITYVEAHGTGTELGDPIEIAALTEAFRASTDRKGFCAVGSVKTNIGHADTAAGVAGLIKTVLALNHKMIPPSLNFQRPNPKINFKDSPFYVNAKLSEWKTNHTPRRAGVSSLGIGGTNAHIILEEAPEAEESEASRPCQLILLSAKTNAALENASANLAEHLKQHPSINLADAAYTLKVGRKRFEHRRAIVCDSVEQAITALESQNAHTASTDSYKGAERPVAFMFSGQGSQFVNMGRGLYSTEHTFREVVDYCSQALKPELGTDLRTLLYPDESWVEEARRLLDETRFTQPALFVVGYALANLWMEWGVRPQAMIGHSIGEYVAACLAQVFSLEDGLKLVAARGRLVQELPRGAMLAVALSEQEVKARINGSVSVAAINAPAKSVLSGPLEAIEEIEHSLAEAGVVYRRLQTSHAFHSQMMEPVATELSERMRRIELKPPRIPYISNVSGGWIKDDEATDPLYWKKHLRQAVRFADGVAELLKDPKRILLEVGPGDTLAPLVRQQGEKASSRVIISSLGKSQGGQPDERRLLNTLGRLWMEGAKVDWSGFYARERRRRVPLPTYPFERKRYWVERNLVYEAPVKPATGRKPDIADWFYIPSWKRSVPPQMMAADQPSTWLVFVDECGPGSQLVNRLEQEGQQVISVIAGNAFHKLDDRLYSISPARRDDYGALLGELSARGLSPRRIVHLWNVTDDDRRPADDSSDELLNKGFYSLLFLAQKLGEQILSEGADRLTNDNSIQIAVVSNNLQEVTGGEGLSAEKAAMLGPVTVIPQEYPGVSCRSIDISFDSPASDQQKLIGWLIAETIAQSPDSIIAYRGNHRWVQTFEAVKLNASNDRAARLRERGVYLITGGLGGVGLELAQHLAQTAQARLVLTCRSTFPERAEWDDRLATHDEQGDVTRKILKLRRLEALGAETLIVKADVTSFEEMQAAVAQARARFGRIDGVIHAAGSVDGRMILLKAIEAASSVLAPKVKGARVLESLFEAGELDFLLLCSSIRSYIGGVGAVDYCAANAFLDAFARANGSRPSSFTALINWDGWREVGMSVQAAEGLAQNAEASGDEGMSSPEGVEVFSRILDCDLAQVVVLTRDFPALVEQSRIFMAANSLEELEKARPSRPAHPRPQLDAPYIAPRNDVERTLAEIWQSLLGLEQVGMEDNFFELGGDSVISIQLIAKANQAGLKLTPRQVFEHQTIAELAAVAGLGPEIEAAQGIVTGRLPLTPVQHWFLEQRLERPHHFNQSVLFEVRRALDISLLERAVRHILEQHDALRLRLVREEAGWRLFNAGTDGEASFSHIDFSTLPASLHRGAIEQAAAELQASLDIFEGPLVRVALFELGADYPSRMAIVIHHLAIDAISWQFLLEDLEAAYQQLERGEAVNLPPKTTSFKQWAERLTARAQSPALQMEASYWLAENRSKVTRLPSDYTGGANTVASTDTVSVSLGVEDTRALLTEIPLTYRTQINDVLLTALGQAFARWTGRHFFLVDLEGHGREAIFDDVDLSRTTGWFTTIFPVLLDMRNASSHGTALKTVKEELRRMPNRGIGYGMLRYLSQDAAVVEKLCALPQSDVSFLYLGQFDQGTADASAFGPAVESGGPVRYTEESRRYMLEISGSVYGDRLNLSWVFSKNLHRRATIEALAESFLESLRSLIEHCRNQGPEGYTPSDFPEAELTEKELEDLMAKLGQVEE